MSEQLIARLPKDVKIDFGSPAPGSSNPMPEEIRRGYQERIEASVQAQMDGARLARMLFIGS